MSVVPVWKMWAEMLMCVVFLIAVDFSSQSGQDGGNGIPSTDPANPGKLHYLMRSDQPIYAKRRAEVIPLSEGNSPPSSEEIRKAKKAAYDKKRNDSKSEQFKALRALRAPGRQKSKVGQIRHPIDPNDLGMQSNVKQSGAEFQNSRHGLAQFQASPSIQIQPGQFHPYSSLNTQHGELYPSSSLNTQSGQFYPPSSFDTQPGQFHRSAGSSHYSEYDSPLLDLSLYNSQFNKKN